MSYSLCYLTFSGVKNALIIPNIKLPGFLTLFTLACSSMSVSETCQFFQQLCLNCPSCVNPQRNVALVFNKQLIQRDIKTDVDMFIKYCSIALEVQLLRVKEWIPVIKVFIYRTFWTSSLRMGKKKKKQSTLRLDDKTFSVFGLDSLLLVCPYLLIKSGSCHLPSTADEYLKKTRILSSRNSNGRLKATS